MRKLALSLVLGGMLTGCASSASDEWTKAGATKEQANKDSADCLFEAQTMRGAGAGMTVNQVQYRQCMANKGYTSNK
ncbi:MAG TPA: hypothetical protein VID28_19730 [Methylomirabilota bacterium]|jgi:NAD/NADP transhydrogenase beta subunit